MSTAPAPTAIPAAAPATPPAERPHDNKMPVFHNEVNTWRAARNEGDALADLSVLIEPSILRMTAAPEIQQATPSAIEITREFPTIRDVKDMFLGYQG